MYLRIQSHSLLQTYLQNAFKTGNLEHKSCSTLQINLQ
jgi:hypothetical protein